MARKRTRKPKVKYKPVKLGPDVFKVPKRFVTLKDEKIVALGANLKRIYAVCH